MTEVIRLLCVHQGAELYGSDRVFLQSVIALRWRFPEAVITVHLPQQGLLAQALKPHIDHLLIDEMWVLRLARLHPKNWRNLLRIPCCLNKARKNILKNDVVYINTAGIIGYLLLTRFLKKETILHIHEYSDGIIGGLLRSLARLSGACVIANSQATAKAFDGIASHIVHNGIADANFSQERSPMPLRLLLMGRINSWKGQGLAVEALNHLVKDGFKDIRLDIVGDVFEDQTRYRDELIAKIKEYDLKDRVTMHGFANDPQTFYEQAHIVLVPSTRPEPFGLVALEAMRAGLPVIAADHGGLREIVVQNETGLLIQPNSSTALAEGIRKYVVHGSLLNKHGVSGRKRYDALFTEENYFKNFIQAIEICVPTFSKSC